MQDATSLVSALQSFAPIGDARKYCSGLRSALFPIGGIRTGKKRYCEHNGKLRIAMHQGAMTAGTTIPHSVPNQQANACKPSFTNLIGVLEPTRQLLLYTMLI